MNEITQDNTQNSIPIWQRITPRLILNSAILAVLPIIIVAVVAFYLTSQTLQSRTLDQLTSISGLKAREIDTWISDGQDGIEILSNIENFSENIATLLLPPAEETATIAITAAGEINSAINAVALSSGSLESIFIYDPEGQVLYASEDRLIGRVVNRQPYFNSSLLTDDHVQAPYFDVGRQELVMIITKSLLDDSGRPLAVIGGYLNLSVLSDIMLDRTGLGETGETYLVSLENNYLLTPSRFAGFGQNQALTSEGIEDGLAGNAGTGVFPDYRGVPVFSSYQFVPDLQAVLLTEIDFAEANAGLVRILGIVLIVVVLTILVAIAFGLLTALGIARPITILTDAARRVAAGDFSQRAELDSNNEVGMLARSFNSMADQVQNLVGTLEERVNARTADLATSAEIAAAANQIRERDELISLTVNLIRDRFDFYYVQAYLIDEDEKYAVLSDGTGYAGRRLLGRNWQLPLNGQSLVANTIKSGTLTVVQDTVSDPNWLANDLLPDTRSEIVVPLRVKDHIIGVLDIQHNEVNTFDEAQQQLFQTLADQLSVTFENVNLLADTAERAKRLATVSEVAIAASTERDVQKMLRTASQLTKENFGLYHAHVYLTNYETNRMELVAGAGEAGLEMVANLHSISLDNEQSIVVRAVHTREPGIVNDVTGAANFLPNPMLPATRSELAVPMVVGDKVVGVLDVQDSRVARFHEEDAQVLQILAAQLAVAVENFQVLERAEQAARELDRIFNSTIDLLGAANFEGYFVQLNDAWEDTLGWTREELMAEPFFSFVHPDDVEKTTEANAGIAEGQSIIEFTNRYRKKDGEYLDIAWKASPDMDAGRINFVARDVTEQLFAQEQLVKTLQDVQESQRFLETVANATPDWIFVKDQKYRYTFVNKAFADALNMKSEDFIGKDDFELGIFPEELILGNPEKDIVGFRVDDNKVLKEGQSLRNPYDPAIDAHGNHLILDTSKLPMRDEQENIIAVFGIARDVTERYQQEADIRNRASRMQTATEISSEITSILDIDELLWRTTNIANEKLGHYQTQIFILSEDKEHLELVASSGEVGQQLVANAHSLEIAGLGLVPSAARERKMVVVNDVLTDENHKPNALLPDTRAELAVPIIYGNQLYGVLDIQDTNLNAFGEVERQVKQTLSNQIGAAIQNARQFAETQLREADVQRRATKMQAITEITSEIGNTLDIDELLWEVVNFTQSKLNHYHAQIYLMSNDGQRLVLAAGAGERGHIMVDSGHSIPANAPTSLVARAARERDIVLVNDVTLREDHLANPNLPDTLAELAVPIIYGNEVMGVLDVQDDHRDAYGEIEVQVKRTLANQIAVTIQNARQFELTQIRLQEVLATNAIADFVRESDNLEEMLENVLTVTYNSLGADNSIFSYYDPDKNEWQGFVGVGEGIDSTIAKTLIDAGEHYPHGLEAIHASEVIGVDDILTYPDVPLDFVESLGLKSVLVVPVIVNTNAIGAIFLNYASEKHTFNDDELRLARAIGNQISIGFQRQQAEDAIRQQTAIAQRRAAELETVANVSTASTTILDLDELLQSVVDLTKQNFDLYHAHIYLYNEDENMLDLAAGAGDVGRIMKQYGHRLSMNNQTGLVIRAASTGQPVVENDTVAAPNFLPNPMLSDTRSELAIPMRVGDDLIGVLDLQSSEMDRFDEEDVRIQSTLASQVAVAIRNAMAFERERKTVEQLREVDRLKQEFLANMSHELRTPLNSIIGYSEVLLDGVDGELNEDALEDVEAIHISGKHLLSIINEILDLAKIDAGQMRLSRQEKDIVEILKHIVISSQVLVKDKPVEILLEEANPVEMTYIDPVRMNQIMLNLVGNAIKFTEEGSVTVRYGMLNDDFIRVEIIDTGMGMNAEQLALIFQRFRQVDGSSTRRAGGTGLGLTITKQLVEMHGGEIDVTSEVGTGSNFFFTLPILDLARELEEAEQAEYDARNASSEELESEPVAGD